MGRVKTALIKRITSNKPKAPRFSVEMKAFRWFQKFAVKARSVKPNP
ncbi:hypothetical protein HYS48_01835 [Candidatus Woesearchaeota archaeon]|nr:hypothetical protein [Candidatus Woesearchaeota archaeon]